MSEHRAVRLAVAGSLVMVGCAVAVLVVLGLRGSPAGSAPACTDSYVGAANGSWSTAANWSTGLPGVADVVCIPAGDGAITLTTGTVNVSNIQAESALSISGGELSVSDTTDDSSLAGLTLSSGDYGGAGSTVMASGSTFDWTGGTLSSGTGTLTVPGDATFTLGTGGVTLENYSLVIDPSFTLDSSRLVMFGSTLTTNGTVTMTDGSDVDNNGVGGSQWIASGLVQKTAGTGTAIISQVFTGAGGVSVGSGTFDFNAGGGTVAGAVTVSTGATLATSGTNTFTSASALSGGGTWTNTGTITISSPVTVATVNAPGGSITASGLFTPSGLTTVSGGTLGLDNAGANVLQGLTLSSGAFGGSGPVGIAAGTTFSWSGGTLSSGTGTLTVPGDATFTLGTGGVTLENYSLVIDPSFTLDSSRLVMFGSTLTTNGTVTMTDGSDVDNNGVGGSQWIASGLVQKTAGTGTAIISQVFTGAGGVSVGSGTFDFNAGGGTVAGAVTVSTGATLATSGTNTFTSASALSGGGTWTNTGTITISSPVTVATVTAPGGSITASGLFTPSGLTTVSGGTLGLDNAGANVLQGLTLSSGAFGGSGPVGIAAGTTFSWSGGTLSSGTGTLTVPGDATFTLGTGGVTLQNYSLVIDPAFTLDSSRLVMFGSTLTTNGTVTMTDGSDVDNNGVGGSQWIANGLVQKTAGTGTATISQVFTGAGGVSVGSGTFDFNAGGGTVAGAVTVSTGATLATSGTNTFTSASALSGGGTWTNTGTITISSPVTVATVNAPGGSITASGLFTPSGLTTVSGGTLGLDNAGANVLQGLTLSSGAFGGSGPVGIAAGTTFSWSGGEINFGTGTLTVPGDATFTLGTGGVTLENYSLVIDPAFTLDSSRLVMFGSTLTTNGTVTMTDGSDVDNNGVGGSQWIANGLVQKTAGTGTATISQVFTGAGGVSVGSGTISLNAGSGSIAGGSIAAGATLECTADLTSSSGTLDLSAPTSTLACADHTLDLTGGSLTGVGTVTGNVDNSGGTVNPGEPASSTPGTLTVTGNYVQASGGTFGVDVGGTTAGTGYDQLVVGGTAVLAGTLAPRTVAGFTPAVGQTFDVLTSTGNTSGSFSTVSPSGTGASQLTPSVSTSGVTLTVSPAAEGPPTVSAVIPSAGTTAGGTEVSISGTNLTGASAVTFGGVAAASFVVVSDGLIDATSPAGTAGSVDVVVTTAAGSSATSSADQFTYVAPPTSDPYHSLAPARICDTRPSGTKAGCASAAGPLTAGQTLTVTAWGEGGVPSSGVSAVVVNITAADTTAQSHLTVYPANQPQPTASSLNWVAGENVPNLVQVGLSPTGTFDVTNFAGSTDVVVDVEGYFAPPTSAGAGLYQPLATPARICDTRADNPSQLSGTALSQCEGKTPGPGSVLQVQVNGLGAVPAAGVGAVVLNVTAIGASANGYLTVYPAGEATPTASNVNYRAGVNVANRVIVPVSSASGTTVAGAVDIFSLTGSPAIAVDVAGWFTDASNPSAQGGIYTAAPSPTRVCDTRTGETYTTQCTGKTLGAASVLGVTVTGALGIPADATAVVLNVTATGATAQSHLTVYPTGQPLPTVSDINWSKGQTIPNLVVATVGTGGQIDLSNYAGATDVVVDVVGWYSNQAQLFRSP